MELCGEDVARRFRRVLCVGAFVGMRLAEANAEEAKPAPVAEEKTPPAMSPAPEEKKEAPAPPPPNVPGAPGFDLAKYVRFEGQLRFRYELFDPFAYSAAGVTQADDYVLMRTRLGALFTLHPKVAVRFQLQDSRIWGEEGASTATSPVGSATTATNKVDLHQGYLDLKQIFDGVFGPALSIRIGRQELSYGDQRLVSPLDWSNVSRAWDAAKITIAPQSAWGGFHTDIFASIIRDTVSAATGGGPVPTAVTDLDANQTFHGLYATFDDIHIADGWEWTDSTGKTLAVLRPHTWDLYAFYRGLDDESFTGENGARGNVHEVTLGTRVAGKAFAGSDGGGLDYTGEIVYQTGDFVDDDINAYGFAVMGGYTVACQSLGGTKVRFGAEYDYGSGDDDPNDGDHGTFDPLFPFGHYYQGIQDTFSWKNGQDLAFKLDIFPPKSTGILNAEVQYHFFWLSEDTDGWFNAALGQIRRDPTGSSSNYVGQEVDTTLKYVLVDPSVVAWVGYSHFFAGEFVDDTGDDPDRDFAFAQIAVTF